MLTRSILVLALTVTLANTAFAAQKRVWPADSYNAYNSNLSLPAEEERRLDHAKGSID